MKLTVNIRDWLAENCLTHDGTVHVTASVALDEVLENFVDEDEIDIDIHELLAQHRQIAHIWSVEDVQSVRPDLTEDQAWEVLQNVDDHKDAELGITWLTLEMAAEQRFGDAPETDDRRQP